MNETATATTTKSTGAASALAASLDLSAETPGRAVPVFDGVWLIATTAPARPVETHVRDQQPLFRVPALRSAGGPAGAAGRQRGRSRAGDPGGAAPRTRDQACRSSRSCLPGGGHHLHMAPWHAAFPSAKLLVGPERIPRTANGRKLMGWAGSRRCRSTIRSRSSAASSTPSCSTASPARQSTRAPARARPTRASRTCAGCSSS